MAKATEDQNGSAPTGSPAWTPKIGGFVLLTEQDPKKRDVPPTVTLFLITEVGSAIAAKRDAKGQVVTESVEMKVGDSKKMVVRAVTETVSTYGGIILSAQKQFTEPRRGVLVEALSKLEA